MNINRHNYEALFLMYVDNELSLTEREAVEQFIQLNPDLADELQMLQQAILPGDTIEFTSKEILYKKENGITLVNYEAYFLLYVDNELSTAEKVEVEKFVLQNPQVQPAFTLLLNTRLPHEKIVFAHKEILYRKQAKRIAPLVWMRMAAAAAVFGIVVLLYTAIPVNDDLKTVAVTPINSIPQKQGTFNTPEQKPEITIAKSSKKQQTDVPPSYNADKTLPAQLKQHKTTPVQNTAALKTIKPTISENNIQQPGKTRAYTIDIKMAQEFAINKTNEHLPAEIFKDNFKQGINRINENNASLAAIPKNNSDFIQATFRETEMLNEEENTLLIGNAKFNKNKVRGLLKKATSLFDRRAERDDNDF